MGKFFYRVNDDGMSGDYIHDGDLVLISETQYVSPNEISAIASDLDISRILLRRVTTDGSVYILVPSNPEYELESREEILVVGKVIKKVI
ncbi:LexA family protein [Paenibacillus methanolicus]|uniref:Peptidase S24-like protein n=1 Tax=Paenibacillus methanolicus TaxID=582686 RepID=A0A5S5BK16_9BACL|nr:S24 family peptidase [Paenibacillus methanolicus]TYP67389.1 peptidase S24-like protein [Paenibacillus methanolicus]